VVSGDFRPIGLNGVFFAQKCIRLAREKLTIFYFCTDYISLESTVYWLSEDTVMFEVDVGFARNMHKCNSHLRCISSIATQAAVDLTRGNVVAMAKIDRCRLRACFVRFGLFLVSLRVNVT